MTRTQAKPAKNEPSDLVILRVAAKRAGRAPVTIRSAIHRKRLKGYIRGRDWWISLADLDEYLKNDRRFTRRK